MDLEDRFNRLLGDFKKLEPRVRHLEFDTDVCGERINVRGSYIAFRDAEPTVDDFIGIIIDHIIPFCLPRSELVAAQHAARDCDPRDAAVVYTRLNEKARDLFIKAKKGSNRSGEAGEIILYILIEWLLKAPQIVSKMYLKTSNQMPVHGTDGIHARYDAAERKLYLFWGESKTYESLAGALGAALTSISEFIAYGKEKREIEIVSGHLDLGEIDTPARDAILAYLDPYSEKSNLRISVFACLLIFDFQYVDPGCSIDPSDIEKEFEERFRKEAETFLHDLSEKIGAKGLSGKRFEFFLFPAPSVAALRKDFQSKIGWSND